MKKSKWMFFWSLIICLSLVLIPITPVSAAGTGFTTTITYQNVGLDVAHVTVLYYPEGQTTPISISRPDLPVGASATISIGNLETTPASFRGSAVIKSDVEVAVLMTQIPTTVTLKARPMAGAATQGSPNIWLLAIHKVAGETSLLSVQNLDNSPANIKFTFYGGTTPVSISKNNIPTGGSSYINLFDVSGLADGYSGAVFVESVRSGGSTAGKIAGVYLTSLGTATDGNATESQSSASSKIYMPVAMCYLPGRNEQYLLCIQYRSDAGGDSDRYLQYFKTGNPGPACPDRLVFQRLQTFGNRSSVITVMQRSPVMAL